MEFTNGFNIFSCVLCSFYFAYFKKCFLFCFTRSPPPKKRHNTDDSVYSQERCQGFCAKCLAALFTWMLFILEMMTERLRLGLGGQRGSADLNLGDTNTVSNRVKRGTCPRSQDIRNSKTFPIRTDSKVFPLGQKLNL